MDNSVITIDEIKRHLEDEAELIIKKTNDDEIIEAVERMRQSYFMYYNLMNENNTIK